jgi:hypothetical protein
LLSCFNEPVIPSFAQIQNNELILIEQRMGDNQAIALRNLLQQYQGRCDSDRMVSKIVIDDCSIRDMALSQILEGVLAQGILKVIQISNVHFETNSIEVIQKIIKQKKIQELHFTNLLGVNQNIMSKMLNTMPQAENLLKLKLSQINLNSKELVTSIC